MRHEGGSSVKRFPSSTNRFHTRLLATYMSDTCPRTRSAIRWIAAGSAGGSRQGAGSRSGPPLIFAARVAAHSKRFAHSSNASSGMR